MLSSPDASLLTGGDLHLFADLPGLRLAEASSPASYAKESVTQYRRTVALIGEGSGVYLLDLFRVDGGSQHDWFLHAPSETVAFTGLTLGAEEPGSLAGKDIAWGDLQGNDGNIKGYPNTPYKIFPPGNGYGFLTRPRRGKPAAAWSADWAIDSDTHLRAELPADPTVEVITAIAPGLYPPPRFPRARYVVLRRTGTAPLRSRFAAALEPYGTSPGVDRVDRLDFGDPSGAGSPIALRIVHTDGATDYVFSATDAAQRTSSVGVTLAGRFACARVRQGRAEWIAVAGTTRFSGFGLELTPPRDAWRGSVDSVDVEQATVTTSAALPAGSTLEGQVVYFSRPGYSRASAYRIVRVEDSDARRRVFLGGTVVLGVGRVDEKPGPTQIVSAVPHEYARSVTAKYSGFFQGKRLRSASGATTRVQSITYGQPMVLQVESAAAFKTGETFHYDDLQPGDSFEIPTAMTLP